MQEVLVIIFIVVVGLLVVLEVGLRILGFGNPLIYVADEYIGYLLAPNQRTRRFGNRIRINEYSMRGESIQETCSPSTFRVLILGDSIANGGWWTDQANTISSLMTQFLSVAMKGKFNQVEVLNASANSWGPRNELAYLKRFGSFNAQVVILLINTDDLFATAPTSLPVGRDRNYPDKKPPLALAEFFTRYVAKPKPIPEMKAVSDEKGDRVGLNLDAISKIIALTHQANSEFLLVMTPLLREIGEPGSRDYEIKARQRLSEFAQIEQITYIDFLPVFHSTKDVKNLYQDHIHMNLQGNQVVAEVISQCIVKIEK
ncbi:SGNH/GDSL hydrolase family protein [Aetokthonos hydrillicola Thurmond2011]|uniref:SGNH/GDSL hydrolase family protein n=1 Tax=Aetokthonos hydrillicola Thurmond2011 TaxID=2712845 RepID=A0AAP5M7P1_9CYAN|nr:SGNH/GDSL hydrolase family protein [Aetokthonos hydrillicola]MBO3459065.1 SGNH/GDSL hydrolase family protein [Aetokthonos hydrillicola CCALA 1050]MBW4584763.1 SGNH/GDSL hydrolase family protein [Aetokthonos hydrillicola CCALA 1050]MDR9895310.1 SGNH/GDSL hydrolase family protein [Aetokthonos hydrillicola Thurmond2011]